MPQTGSPDPDAASLSDRKAVVRAAARAAREALTAHEREASDYAIAWWLLRSKVVKDCSSLIGYRAFGSEANVDPVLTGLLSKRRRVFLPRIRPGGQLDICEVFDLMTGQETGSHGIIEPVGASSPVLEHIDVILVPGIAFDSYGRRLGFGKGYYDRLLARLNPRTTCIGVAYECQMVPQAPTGPWDRSVGFLVTEHGIRPALTPPEAS